MGSDFGKCLKEGYVADLSPDDTSGGEKAIDDLIIIAGQQKEAACKAKWNFTFCLVESACWECDQMAEAQTNEVQFKEALKHLIIPCNWNESEVNDQRCTEDHWKDNQEKKEQTTTTENGSTIVSGTSTPFSGNRTVFTIVWVTVIGIVLQVMHDESVY